MCREQIPNQTVRYSTVVIMSKAERLSPLHPWGSEAREPSLGSTDVLRWAWDGSDVAVRRPGCVGSTMDGIGLEAHLDPQLDTVFNPAMQILHKSIKLNDI